MLTKSRLETKWEQPFVVFSLYVFQHPLRISEFFMRHLLDENSNMILQQNKFNLIYIFSNYKIFLDVMKILLKKDEKLTKFFGIYLLQEMLSVLLAVLVLPIFFKKVEKLLLVYQVNWISLFMIIILFDNFGKLIYMIIMYEKVSDVRFL